MTPSSFCGVTGFRPTFGRISRAGVMALSWSLDKVGILGRTALDCGTVFKLLEGRDDDDALALDAPFRPAWAKVLEKASSLTIGIVPEEYTRWGEEDVQNGRERGSGGPAGHGHRVPGREAPRPPVGGCGVDDHRR